MKVTVVLCTHNRCHSLTKALDSIAASILPVSVGWSVLVVDNNSSDPTPDVVADFCRRYPGRFQYLFEPQPGKSHALNAGIRQAQGDVLAFMDDDVIVDPAWLKNLTAALEPGDWAGAGGRILPQWTSSPPRWLSSQGRYALAPLAAFDLGPEGGQLTEPPFGTNMAFRKEIFEKHGGFRKDLGPRPGSEIRSEDTEFGGRLLAAGERLLYVPSAVVHHPVQEYRLTKGYFLSWWFDKGRANVREFGILPGTKYYWFGVPLYLFRKIVVWTVRWMFAFDHRERFNCKLKVWGKAGEIVEFHREAGSRGQV